MVEINGIDLSQYVAFEGIKCNFVKKYDNENEFITESGQHIKNVIGIQRTYDISLGNLPEETKNQLRNVSLRGYVSATIDGISGQFLISNFTSSLTLATDDGNIWSVSLTASYQKIEVDSTVTDKTDYGIAIYSADGTKVARYSITNGDVIGSAKITSNAGGIPFNGIYSSTLTFTVDKNISGFVAPPIGARVEIEGIIAKSFFIRNRTSTKNTITFTCSDRIYLLDQQFPFDKYFNSSTMWKNWTGSEIWIWGFFDAIQDFLGCTWWDYGDLNSPWAIPVDDVKGKTGREILKSITSRRGGIFVIVGGSSEGNDGIKYIAPFSNKNTSIYTPNIRTNIYEEGVKGPIAGVIATNTSNNTIFTSGDTSDPYLCIKIEGKGVTQSDAEILLEQCSGKAYTGFKIDKVDLSTSALPCLGYKLIPEESSSEYYYASSITSFISATGAYASFSAEEIVEDELQFVSELQSILDSKIEEGKKYNGISIDNNGLKCEGTAGKITMADGTIHFYGTGSSLDYTISTKAGGLTQYTGVMESNKEVYSIDINPDDNTVTVMFKDGHTYTYSATVEHNGNTFSITDERSSWT